MKKTMYSLMLAEDVIREIDRLAAEKNTNRSNLVNQILAEYVSMTTPEKHVQNIFDIIERFIGQQSGYLLYSQPNHPLRSGDVPQPRQDARPAEDHLPHDFFGIAAGADTLLQDLDPAGKHLYQGIF